MVREIGTHRLPAHFELNLNLGFLANTKNLATDYHSGSSIHLDYTLAYDVTKQFQLGFSGYYYQQVTGDSGSGATLGDFKGEGVGIGPSLQYILVGKKVGNNRRFVVFNLTWIHDTHVENRVESDWVTLMVAVPMKFF